MMVRIFLTVMPGLILLPITPYLSSLGKGAQGQPAVPIDSDPRLAVMFDSNMRFGLTVLKDVMGKPVNKRLTYSDRGDTNSTVVRIDGKDYEFGSAAGKWIEKQTKIPNGARSIWAVGSVHISQVVEIVPSQQPVEVAPGVRKRLLDTCLIRYIIENKDTNNHTAGLRIQVDTLIGSNDGVPFAVPSLQGLVATFKDFASSKDIPEFVQALEVPDLLKPGTVGHMTLKVGGQLEPPSRVSLTHWPGFNFTAWEVPVVSMRSNMRDDSAVVIYWNANHQLTPNETRNLGFAYGLGRVSSNEGTGKLALTVNGSFAAGEPFTVTAYVQDPVEGQTLTLEVPPGLERVEGKPTEIVPPPSKDAKNTSVITWKVKASKLGHFTVKVHTSTGISQTQQVSIHEADTKILPKVDHGKLLPLAVTGRLAVGQVLTLTATVKNPLPDQHLFLKIPTGLERVEGDEKQTVPALAKGQTEGDSSVVWKIKAHKAGDFNLEVSSSAAGLETKAITIRGAKTDVTILDARRALQMSVGNLPEDLELDMDGDGHVTSQDAAIILQRVAEGARKGN